MKITEKSALSLGKMLQSREISVIELLTEYLKETEAKKDLNAFITICRDESLKRANIIQKNIDDKVLSSPLAGVPMAVKDNICTKNILTSCASKMLSDFKPPYSATAVERLEKAGAVLIGKTNMDEFAMGGSTESSYYGSVKNPTDTKKVSGGSSGGTAAAVASNQCAYGLGSDTGGSVRQPASFCGITGLMPTYGSVSRYGLIAYASSLDRIGVMGKNMSDCAAVLSEIYGSDKKDMTCSVAKKTDFTSFCNLGIIGMKIGIPRNFFSGQTDAFVGKSVLQGARELEKSGAELYEFELPLTDYYLPTYYITACAEASSNLSRYDGIKYGFCQSGDELEQMYVKTRTEGFGLEVKRRIMLGTYVLRSGYYEDYYKKALKVRRLIKDSFDDAFKKYDLLLTPTAPTTAYNIGENRNDPLKMYQGDIFTVAASLSGIPAASIPCGKNQEGMPIGMQLMAPQLREDVIVRVGCAYEKITGGSVDE